MRRTVRLVAALVVATAMIGASGAGASAASVEHRGCPGTVQITSFAFTPSTVAPGQRSTATLTADNCTPQTRQTRVYWYGRFVGSSPGIPAGCPAIDPYPGSATFPPRGSISQDLTWLVFPSCTATSLELRVQIVGSDGAQLATSTATLAIGT